MVRAAGTWKLYPVGSLLNMMPHWLRNIYHRSFIIVRPKSYPIAQCEYVHQKVCGDSGRCLTTSKELGMGKKCWPWQQCPDPKNEYKRKIQILVIWMYWLLLSLTSNALYYLSSLYNMTPYVIFNFFYCCLPSLVFHSFGMLYPQMASEKITLLASRTLTFAVRLTWPPLTVLND